MQDTIHLSIDYPQENEKIVSNSYTFRVAAPVDAPKVELSVDGGEFQPMRQAAGFWWYDWAVTVGRHQAVVRIHPEGAKPLTLQPRTFVAQPAPSASMMTTQYSVLVPNDPAKLAFVTDLLNKQAVEIRAVRTLNVGENTSLQFLASDKPGLRKALENTGFPVVESQVFQLELPESQNGLHSLAQGLAQKGINVLSLYGMGERQNVKVVLSVDQPEVAASLFETLGISVLN